MANFIIGIKQMHCNILNCPDIRGQFAMTLVVRLYCTVRFINCFYLERNMAHVIIIVV